jgi:hypothetical protein
VGHWPYHLERATFNTPVAHAHVTDNQGRSEQRTVAMSRCREDPPRSFVVWAMDVSKQVASSGAAHLTSILVAVILQREQPAADRDRDISECAWYFVVFTIGTTLGVVLTLWMHRWIMRIAQNAAREGHEASAMLTPRLQGSQRSLLEEAQVAHSGLWNDLAACGDYGTPPCVRRWALQVCNPVQIVS